MLEEEEVSKSEGEKGFWVFLKFKGILVFLDFNECVRRNVCFFY